MGKEIRFISIQIHSKIRQNFQKKYNNYETQTFNNFPIAYLYIFLHVPKNINALN